MNEYSKVGKVIEIEVVTHTDHKYAVINFGKMSDASKALNHVINKSVFGTTIESTWFADSSGSKFIFGFVVFETNVLRIQEILNKL